MQRRLTEAGRIRIGVKGAKGQPVKLDKFRLTSRNRPLLEQAAALYGGQVTEWTGAPTKDEQFELTTTTAVLPVAVPPGQPVSQWYEVWSGGGCQHRCDGYTDTISGQPCDCGERDDSPEERVRAQAARDRRGVKATTRLNVILTELPSIGVWRLESHGYYAASELAGVAELLAQATTAGRVLPAFLRLEQRQTKRAGKTNNFVVPVLEVAATVATVTQQLAGPARAAIDSTPPAAPRLELEAAADIETGELVGEQAEALFAQSCERNAIEEYDVSELIHRATGGRTSTVRDMTTAEYTKLVAAAKQLLEGRA